MNQENLPHILVVDDEVSYLHAMKRVFRRHYGVFTAENLTVAQSLLQAHADTIALLLVDFHIGAESGLELLNKIRAEERHNIQFILMTGAVSEEIDGEEIQKSGADGFLHKPFDNDEVIALVERLFAEKKRAQISLLCSLLSLVLKKKRFV